jgi:RNA polymerase sigma factor (sigma-70 family)
MTAVQPFASLYVEHLPAARRTALSLVPVDAVDDIVAEAFMRVLAACHRGGGPSGAFRPYLLAAVRNVARTWLVQRRREVPVPLAEQRTPAPGAGELAARREELRMVSRAFGSLPSRWRMVLWETEVERRQVTELAAVSGMTPNAVSQLAVRAREGLAVAWDRERGPQMRDTGPLLALRRLGAQQRAKNVS